MDELRLTLSRTGSKQNRVNKRSELITIMGRGGKTWLSREWKTVELNSVSSLNNRRYTYALAETLREQLGNVSCQNPSECLGLLIMHGDIPLRKQPFLPQPPWSRLVESHKAYCGNRQVEGVRVLRNNVLSFKRSLLSKESKSSIDKPPYTY